MHFCSHCETILPPDAAICPACGTAAPAPPALASAWTASLPAPPAHAPVAFAGNVLLAGGSPERAATLEWRAIEDGRTHRQHTFDRALINGLAACENQLLLSLTSSDLLHGQGALVALDAAGEELWRWTSDVQQVSAPAIAGDVVYVTADAGLLIAIDLVAGAEQARYSLPVSASQAAPAVAGETLCLPCRGPHLLAYTLSGELRWRYDAPLSNDTWLHHTPALCAGTLFTTSSTATLLALQTETGKLRSQVQVGPPNRALSAPVTDGECLYIGARDGLHALDLDAHEVWHFPTQQKITAAPVVIGGVVYATGWDRQLYALDAATGRERWRYTAKRHLEVSPLILPAGSQESQAGDQAYAVIADAGGTVTALTRPLSAAELESAGWWVEAASAYAALEQPARGAELLEAHDEAYKAAQLWEVAGDPARAAAQYEAAGYWERAVELWEALKQPLRQAEALQQYARSLVDDEAQIPLWKRAAALYAKYDQPALAEQCQLEVARCLRQPDIALDIEHDGLVLNKWTQVHFIVHNAGFGPAHQLIIHTDRKRFEGEAMATQRISTLKAGEREMRILDLQPLAFGDSVPLRVSVDFTDHTGKALQCTQTIHLPVAQESAIRAAPTHTQVLRAAAHFVDLAIRIFRRNHEGHYPVEITLANQQLFTGAITDDLRAWKSSGDAVRDGRALFTTLIADPALAETWARCRGRATQRRVRLWLDTAAPELHVLPWETLHEADLPLAASEATPFSRYLPTTETWGDATTTRPIRMLMVIANPTDLEERGLTPIDVAQEQTIITKALAGVNDVKVDFLTAPVTLDRLEERLREGYHLLHIVGHGTFSSKGQAALLFQDVARKTQFVTDTDFAAMLRRQNSRPSLITLATCHGATRDTADAWRGLAPQLVSAGVPAVIAMQGAIPQKTAQAFTGAFYRALVKHGTVDLALNQARSLLISQRQQGIALPVLVMRLMDGQLF